MKKIKFRYPFLVFISIACYLGIQAQTPSINPKWIDGFWDAFWITHPTASAREYGVFHFRKAISLEEKPASFVIHVSADNRYRLLVNEVEVSLGPARGDIEHWRFESIDIAPYLQAGKNVLAAVVWNFGMHAPVAQVSQQTAFILQGDGEKEKIVNTDASWKVMQNEAYSPETESLRNLQTYLVVGPGDQVNGALYPWGWQKQSFDDNQWQKARTLSIGQGFGRGTDGNWRLVPRQIPMMDKYSLRLQKVRRSEGIQVNSAFLKGQEKVSIPANTRVSILLDQTYLTTAYPEFKVSGGKASSLKVSYSEALFDEKNQKGNRNEMEGKEMRGYADIFYPDGGSERIFRPLWLRTWRYMQLDIETMEEALILEGIQAFFTGYPLEEKASFKSDQAWLDDIWDTGWRTARLCAGETYYDCPYYEQLQYVGDTRIQALISLYVAGDDRLVRRAINDFEESRIWNGLTQSRYPCEKLQVIPTYSLFWIAMIHDYWMHRTDIEYVQSLLPGIRAVLGWYEKQINDQNLFGRSKWWNFVDWAKEWPWDPEARIGGVPAQDADGNSSVLTFQYAYALRYAAELHRAFGQFYFADQYDNQRIRVLEALQELCWNEEQELFSDLPGSDIYSQHANIFAILTDAIPADQQKELMKKILEDKSMIQATFYFKFYLFRALVKTGMADQYLAQLKPWQDMLELGLTTFAEKPDPTRSDCHAWSASPNYDLLATVAGIIPGSPGFQTVRIAPALNDLQEVSANMPHPKGEIRVTLKRLGAQLKAEIDLPEGVPGVLLWEGEEYKLSSGKNVIPTK